jgi:choice-of-anchor B domain-containing protein
MLRTPRLSLLLLATALLYAPAAFAHDGDPKLLDRKPGIPGSGWTGAQRRGPGGNLNGSLIYFPSRGVQLLAWMSLTDLGVPLSGNGNSCFGYVSPSGREYAIMGLSNGTAFIEITQPSNPVVVAQISGPQSLWRDMKVFGTHCYAASEGGSGIQVMNMSAIDSGIVTLVNTINDDATGATHTLALNTDSGYLYRSGGSSNGLRFYNLNINPANPQRNGQWSDRYVHEPTVVSYTTGPAAGKEIAYCCGGFNGGFNSTGLYVVDVTNKASPVLLSYVPYTDSSYAHQAWLSPDRQWLYLNDELDEQNDADITAMTTRVFNASNPLAVTYVGRFTNGLGTVDHNLYTKSNLLYESNYTSGIRIFDATVPTAPVEIGYFDTRPEDNGETFNGLWNNYVYFPSGVVIGSDIERAFFVWWVGTPLVSFAHPGPTPTVVHPGGALVPVQVNELNPGALQAGTAKIHVDTGSGFVAYDLVHDGGSDFRAPFPMSDCGSVVSYYFTAESTNGVLWSDPASAPEVVHTIASGVSQSTLFSDDFENNLGWTGTTAGDTATSGTWTRVDPVWTAAQPELDHSAGAGTRCWATGQGAVNGALGSADVDGGQTTLTTPTLDLSSANAPVVSYWRWYSNDQGATGMADTFRVDVSNNNGSSWTNVETVGPSGPHTSGGWIHHQFAVSAFVPLTSQVKVRFVADDAGTGHIVEAAVDDFTVTDQVCIGSTGFCSGDGSATPCPCGNVGAPGSGCAHAFGPGGLLSSTGTPSIANDTLVLNGTGMPSGTLTVFFQGSEAENFGLGAQAADGIRCTAGQIIRLGTKTTILGGSANYPELGNLSVSAHGLVSSPGSRYYQIWYRNSAAFCTPATTNYTNGRMVVWAP